MATEEEVEAQLAEAAKESMHAAMQATKTRKDVDGILNRVVRRRNRARRLRWAVGLAVAVVVLLGWWKMHHHR